MQQAVYDFLTTIPRGKVVTYKQIAIAIGHPNSARVVGNILHHNPNPIQYPCYKVVNSEGKLSTHFSFGGLDAQRQLLEQDEVKVINDKVDLTKYQYHPKNTTIL